MLTEFVKYASSLFLPGCLATTPCSSGSDYSTSSSSSLSSIQSLDRTRPELIADLASRGAYNSRKAVKATSKVKGLMHVLWERELIDGKILPYYTTFTGRQETDVLSTLMQVWDTSCQCVLASWKTELGVICHEVIFTSKCHAEIACREAGSCIYVLLPVSKENTQWNLSPKEKWKGQGEVLDHSCLSEERNFSRQAPQYIWLTKGVA